MKFVFQTLNPDEPSKTLLKVEDLLDRLMSIPFQMLGKTNLISIARLTV